MISYQGERAHLWLLGVRNGDRAYLKFGAVIGLYYFSLQHVAARGCTKANLGWSRGFLDDGPLRYKRKLGLHITRSSDKAIAMNPVRLDAATCSFLKNNPVIIESGKGLLAAVFVDGDSPLTEAGIRQMNKDHLYAGLSRLSIYRLPGAGSTSPSSAAQRLSIPLQVRGEIDELCVPKIR